MKLKILFVLCFFSLMTAKAQIVSIANETFESTLSGWTIIPSNSWKADTNLYAGGHTSYRGIVPTTNNAGDTSIIISPVYDLQSYGYVWLTFSHICKVSASDICQIEYREDFIGSTWKSIPTSSYEGSGIYTNAMFSHESYADWQPGDSLATPLNGWWKTEQFDISDEASFARVQFRFKITRGSVLGTYFVYGWLIDNFQINASVNPIAPPVVELISTYSDTVYNTGPFLIKAKAATRTIAPLLTPKLYYSATIGGIPTNDSILMTAIEGDSIWSATIPQHFYGTTITYAVVASDSVTNTNTANGGFYIQRPLAGGYTGYVIVGNGTVTDYYTPASMYYKYSWARMLYLSNEISSNNMGGLITKLAWSYDNATGTTYGNQTCFFKMVDDTALVTGYVDPIVDGATQVWAGTLNIAQGWVEINLNTPFYLPPNKNLQVYWHHKNGAYLSSTSYWNHTNTSPAYRTVQAQNDGSFPSGNAGSLRYDRPNARFFVISPSNDSNAVALLSIDNPTKGTVGGTQPVKVTIKNKGLDYLDSCVINWSVNNVLQSPVVWRGYLLEDFNDTITLGYYTQRYNMFDTIVVWVGMPNGVVDTTTWDDTLRVVSYGCYGPISGDFIVGTASGANVPSINDAFFIGSKCGVNGDVTLKLQNDTYIENWDFTDLADIMGNYTLTITSLSGNRDSVILKPAADAGITLNNTNNFIVKDITIDNTSNNDYGIEFTGIADNVEIRNIHFIGDKTGTSSTASPAPIYKASGAGLVDDVRFIGNTIEGGYYGIYFYGGTGTSAYGTNVIFDSNIVFDQYYYATYFYYTDFTSVSYNSIYSRTLNAATTWYGLRLYNCDFVAKANRIHGKISFATFYGVYFYNSGNALNPSLFANNEVIGITSSTYYGIYSGSTSFVDIINNSIHMSGSGASRNIYIANSTGANYTIKNNLLVNTSSGYPIYFSGSTTPFTSDYNCLYGSSNVGYITSARTSLSAWQSATGQDANSISVNPSFVDVTTNLKLSNYTGFYCYMMPNVNHDIEGMNRTSRTYMGCYTAPLLSSNGAIAEILHLDMPAHLGDTSMLEVVLLNAGLDTIHAATINWSINHVLQPTINWNGNLASLKSDTLSLGSIIYQNGYNYVDVWLSGIGALTDSVSYDDTLGVYTYACYDSLSGDFIVGNYPGADVQTINDAFYIAGICGVKGDVTLKFQNDTYSENWDFTNLSDLMGTHTLTITSLSGNRDSVILKPATGAGIILNNTDNLVIKDITIDNTSNNDYGLYFTDAVTNVEIRNVHFIGDKIGTAAATSPAPIYKGSSTGIVDDVRFIGNTIEGGYYGIYFYGGTGTSAYGTNVVFDKNTVFDQYYYATYFYYTDFTSVSYNTIYSKTLNAATTWYGLRLYNCDFVANANRIHAKISFATFYGVYMSNAGTTTNPSMLSNNEIIGITSGTTYGIYGTSANIVNIINNSVHMSGTGASRNLYFATSTSANYNIQNNILIHAGNGYPIYFAGTTTPFTSDNNCMYGNSYVGYYSSAKLTLSDWQTATGQDSNSVSFSPSFVNTTLGLELTDYSSLSCTKYPNVNYDINDSIRMSITAMGCYTPIMSGADGALTGILNWKTTAVYAGDTSHLKVILFNSGATTITTANIRWKFNNVVQPIIHWTGNLLTGTTDTIDLDTVTYISKDNDVVVWISSLGVLNDTTQINDTVRAFNYACDSMLNGYYTIGATGDFADMDEAVVRLNLCGINGPVTFAIQPGTYLQNTTIGYINGTSPTNTITFTSTTGDSTDVKLQRADDATTSIAPIMITNGENIIIEKVTLSGLSPVTSTYSYSHGIIITGTSRNIEVRNCHIYGPKNFSSAVTGTNQNPVRIKDATVYDIRILNNLIEGGSCGVYVYGTNSTTRITNVVVKDNTIGFVDTYGIYLYYGDSILVEGNRIVQRTGNFTSGNLYGIYVNYVNADLLSNKIWAASFYHGMYLYYLNNEVSRSALVANNEIIGNHTSTSRYGIYAYTAAHANIYHNSLYLGGDVQSRGIYVYNDTSIYVDIKNNNIIMNVDAGSDPYPIYLGSTTYFGTKWTINYNNYYNVNGTNIGYAGGAITSLSAWKATVTMDSNSVSVNPNFLDISTSMMLLDSNGLSCPRLPIVLNDIQDSLRSPLTTMGAYHFEPARLDVLPLAFTTPSTTVAVGVSTPISVIIVNNGLDTITSVMIACEINGMAITPSALIGTLAPGDTSSIQLGTFIPQSFENSIVVYTYLPNGQADQFKINDTIRMEAFGCDSMLSGTYTIGATGDFTSIDKAIKTAELCGISSSVVFEIQNGTYTNHLSIGQIPGASDTNTVTFVSQTRNASNVIINVSQTALRLNQTAHLNFKYITIYGSVIAVELLGMCENIEFYRCTLATSTTTTNSAYRVINYDNTSGSGNYLKDVRFIKNTLSGGYSSMYLYYAGSSSTDMANSLITIDSNIMVDAYYYGIYAYYYAKYKSISYNTIIMRSSTSTQYGIYTNYTTIDDGMIGNRVVTNTSSTNYGIRLYYINRYVSNGLALIANNEVICNGGSSTIYGLYCYYNTAKIYHNSVSISGAGTAYALYIGTMSSSTDQMYIYNNIFASSSTGTPYAIYAGTAANATQSNGTYLDYNDYYSSGSDLGYIGSAMSSLSALRTATGQDNNSINVNPNFVSASDLHLTSYTGFDCPRMSEVDKDIQNYIRKNTTNMGAYAKEPGNIDAELVEFIGFKEAYAGGGSQALSVIVRNSGFNPIDSVTISGKVNNVDIVPVAFNPATPLLFGDIDTVSLGSYTYVQGINNVMAAVTLTGDTLQDNDTIRDSRYMCNFIMGGDYVIGSSPAADYPTVDSLMADVLRCGINADLTLKFESGTYTGSWNLLDLGYFLGNYTLTVTSLANHSDSVVFANTSGVLVNLNNTYNVIVKHITLDATAGTYAVEFTGDASNIVFDSCKILASPTATTSSYAAIYKATSTGSLNGLTIKHCLIDGGYDGIHIYGTSSDYANGITIDSNIVSNQYYYGIYLYYVNSKSTSYNFVTPRSSNAGTTWYGIWVSYNRNGGNIIGNRIYGDNQGITGSFYGMRHYYIDSALVANNDIYIVSAGSPTYGIYTYNCVQVDYMHNTILLNSTGSIARAMMYTGGSGYYARFMNNILVVDGGTTPYAFYLATAFDTQYHYFDYNTYYSSGNMGYLGGAQPTLTDWKMLVTTDVNSTFELPNFIDVTQNLKLSSFVGYMVPLTTEVPFDREGVIRDVFTAKGAYEANLFDLDAAMIDFDTTNLLVNISSPVTVKLMNVGRDTLTSATIHWTFNGVAQTPYPWNGNISTFNSSIVNIGNVIPLAGMNHIVAWVSNPNNSTDSNTLNDTIYLDVYACTGTFSGVYTVGGVNPDFTTIDEAFTALYTCGISGSVTLSLATGIYPSLQLSGNITGANNNNIVHITSAAGDPDSVVFNGETYIYGTSYLKFTNVTFDAISNGKAVSLSGNTDNIEISHCNIFADPIGTASTTAGIYKSSSSGSSNNIRIIGNRINGGYYGVYLYGSSSDYVQNVILDSNIITNQYYYGVYYYYVNSISTSYNMVTPRSVNQGTTWYGMRLYQNKNGGNIIGNKIHADNAAITSGIYGLYTYYIDSALVANNEIYLNSTATNTYGIYIDYPKGSKILHNSVLITGPSATARALYWYVYSSDSYDATVMNNLFITNTGGSTPYAVYLAGTYSSAYAYNYRIDYNNYYSTGNMGYVGSVQATLANWKSVVISDIYSTFIIPVFAHVNSNLELTDYSAFIVPRINDVPVDINGINRTILTMMGAYSEPLFEGYDLELIDILSPKPINDVYCFGDYTDVKVILKNAGTENYYFDTNSVNLHLDVSGVYYYRFDTLITVGTLFASKKDTFDITNLLPVSLPGTYHISVYLSSAVDTVYNDDTLHMDYTVSKIQLPYDVDFSYKQTDIILKQVLGTSAWQLDTGTGSNPTIAPVFGNGRLSFASESGLGSMAQAIINGIDLRGMAQPSLEFWYAHDATSSNNDFMSVKVSTNGGGSFDNLLTVYRYDATYSTPGWAHYVVDLSDYDTNACVSIVFEANSFGGANQNIDRIRIASKPDVSINLIAPEETDLIACNLSNQTLKVVVSNLTALPIDFDVDTSVIYLNVSGITMLNFTHNLSGILAGMTSDTIEITNTFDLSKIGTYRLKAYLDAVDSNFVNDTAKVNISINPNLSIKDINGVDNVNCKQMGDSVYVSFKILNIGNLLVEEIPVRLQINGTTIISETAYTQLFPGDSMVYAFTKPYVVPVVTKIQPFYNVRIQTELSCDANTSDNIQQILACVTIPDTVDLQIQSINYPIENVCDTGLRTVYVSVTLSNTGNNDISSSILHVEVDSAGTTWASFSETTVAIPAGNNLTHVFTQGYVVPNFNGNYNVRVYIDSIENDNDLNNDTLAVQACAVLDDVSIDEFGNINWTMDQNIPNPATSIIRIPYAIPQDGQISFKVMTINGQILYTKQLQATAGSHSIEMDLNNLSNGIYYYSMEYQGQRIVKKMTVQR